MKNVKYPWVRWRVSSLPAHVDVPPGWTLSVRFVDPDGAFASLRPGKIVVWCDGELATIPTGLVDIRLRKGVHASFRLSSLAERVRSSHA
jgi:hypothetical protein